MNAKEFTKELIKASYREFKPLSYKYADKGFQKRFKDGSDTKYFITAYYYGNDGYSISPSVQISLQFHKLFKGKEITIDITLFNLFDWNDEESKPEYHSVKLIEEYIEEFFNDNKFEYYDTY